MAVLSFTWLLLSVATPRIVTMPPPPRPPVPSIDGGRVWLLAVTELLLSVSLATLAGSKVALAMPPPAPVAVLAVTWLRFRVTVPPMLAMPPPLSADPPVTVTLLRLRFPAGPSTSKSRTAPVPSTEAPLPFTVTPVVTIGRPFSPLSAVVSA